MLKLLALLMCLFVVWMKRPWSTQAKRAGPEMSMTVVPTGQTNLFVVLGHMPYNCTHISIDAYRRVETACQKALEAPIGGSDIVLSGGDTLNCGTTEAQHMHAYLLRTPLCKNIQSHGVHVLLENEARTTTGNAKHTEDLLKGRGRSYDTVFVVSRAGHLEWGLPGIRRRGGLFTNAKPLPSNNFDVQEDIDFLSKHMVDFPDDKYNAHRLEYLKWMQVNGEHPGSAW
eukprot:TRINITY_DN113119_c0_g1_i1.p1 TRINITY_DN113119_c0_g1~~TRINITY_DN113119_c0_g1_i1.p1  ORF type:complete len:228 (-),score=17.45 TRINITY_DN113119_c0_g1_i1:50-733(-)